VTLLAVLKPAASSSSIFTPKKRTGERSPEVEGRPATPMKALSPSKARPKPTLYHTTAEIEASSKFFSRMLCVPRAVTEPASSMPKPHCIKKTKMPLESSHHVEADPASKAPRCSSAATRSVNAIMRAVVSFMRQKRHRLRRDRAHLAP